MQIDQGVLKGDSSQSIIVNQGTTPWIVSEGQSALTPAAPASATVGIASAQILAANSSRKGLVIINTHASNSVSLGFGAPAVLFSGVTLSPNGGVFVMDSFLFATTTVTAIASGATTNVSIQEYN